MVISKIITRASQSRVQCTTVFFLINIFFVVISIASIQTVQYRAVPRVEREGDRKRKKRIN